MDKLLTEFIFNNTKILLKVVKKKRKSINIKYHVALTKMQVILQLALEIYHLLL